jgi:hypothetical protein
MRRAGPLTPDMQTEHRPGVASSTIVSSCHFSTSILAANNTGTLLGCPSPSARDRGQGGCPSVGNAPERRRWASTTPRESRSPRLLGRSEDACAHMLRTRQTWPAPRLRNSGSLRRRGPERQAGRHHPPRSKSHICRRTLGPHRRPGNRSMGRGTP